MSDGNPTAIDPSQPVDWDQHLDLPQPPADVFYPPEWLLRYQRAWWERLELQEWQIRVEILLPDDPYPDRRALTQLYPDINTADISYRHDVEDTPAWRKTVIHELLHVRMARITHWFEFALLPTLPRLLRPIITNTWHQLVEAFIDKMDQVLYRATCKIDYPEEFPYEPESEHM